MSASQMERLACSHAQIIPSKRVLLTDPSQLPDVYSSTPGGTLYSTTPGGTKIIYERSFLMNLKNSPLGRTPPKNCIPSGLVRGNPHSPVQNTKTSISRSPPKPVHHHHQQQQQQQKKQPPQDEHEQLFDMDI